MKDKIDLKIKEDELYDSEGGREDPIARAKLDAIGFILGESDPITEAELEPPENDADLDNIIAELKKDRDNIPEYSYFGDPNWRIIDTQIQICEWAKGEDQPSPNLNMGYRIWQTTLSNAIVTLEDLKELE